MFKCSIGYVQAPEAANPNSRICAVYLLVPGRRGPAPPGSFRVCSGSWSVEPSDRPLFRRGGLPVRLIRSKRGWMLSCVRDRGWVVPLLSALLSAAGSTGSRGMLTAMPADLPCRRARNGYGRCSLAPRRCCLRNSLGSQKPTGSASHVCPIGTESVTHEPFGAGGAEPTPVLGHWPVGR